MLVGPSATDVNNDITVAAGVPGTTPLLATGQMTYQVTFAPPNAWTISVPPASRLSRRHASRHPDGLRQYQWRLGVAAPSGQSALAAQSVHGRRHLEPIRHCRPIPISPSIMLPRFHSTATDLTPPTRTVSISLPGGFAVPVPTNNSPNPPAAYGKLQPYASAYNQYFTEAKVMAPGPNRHTLGLQNLPLASPFSWLVHLDRKLVSPMELLPRVRLPSARIDAALSSSPPPFRILPEGAPFRIRCWFRNLIATPFGSVNCIPFQHYAPWFNQTNRLYRLVRVARNAGQPRP